MGDEEKLFAAIESGKDVKLSQSIVITSCLRIPQGKKLTLDLNGKTIDRGLRVSQDIGSVIRVEPGAELTITDSTNTNAGIITGGASWNGGGICNHGTLTIKGGTISGNLAVNDTHGGGGGIYNGSYMGSTAILTIEGGVIENNQARNGAGIYNGQGGTVIIKQGYYEKKVLGKQKKFYTNLTLRSNAALQKGSGIYNDGTLKIQDSPVIYSNKNNEDIFIAKGRKITFTGALNSEGLIGVLSEGGDPVITEDYGKYNSVSPGKLFMSSSNDYVLKLTAVNNSEIKLKNSGKTTVEVYEDAYVLRGEVVGTTRDKGLFTLKTASGESYSIRINDSISETVDKAESGFGWGGSPFRPKALVMITGEGTFRPDGTLKSVNTVDSMDPIDPLDPTVRLDELRNLKDGWLEGHGKAPSSDGLDWLAEFFQDSYPADLPLPYLYPMEDGGISAEWEVGDKEIDVEIDLDNRRGTGIFYKDADEEFAVSFKDEASVKELRDRIRSLKGGDVNE